MFLKNIVLIWINLININCDANFASLYYTNANDPTSGGIFGNSEFSDVNFVSTQPKII